VTVVIVNYNAGGVLADCLEGVLSQAAEVVVVDNASEPHSFEPTIARFEADRRVRVIRSPENRGFAAGCNEGVRVATQPFVFFLNPDCIVAAGSIRRLVDALDAHPEAALAGGLLVFPNGVEQGGGRRAVPTPWRSFVRAFGLSRFAARWPRLFDDFHLHYRPLPSAAAEVEAISGACMLVRRSAIDHFGMMDEGFFLHCEDLDFCMRAREHGWTILFVPDAPVVHLKGVCSRDRPIFVEWHKHKGMIRFYRKHFQRAYPLGLMQLVMLGVWIRFAAVAGREGVRTMVRRRREGAPLLAPASGGESRAGQAAALVISRPLAS
jgi:GT2 family glycosyltransferase